MNDHGVGVGVDESLGVASKISTRWNVGVTFGLDDATGTNIADGSGVGTVLFLQSHFSKVEPWSRL
mgnify:CR=1 FL=1